MADPQQRDLDPRSEALVVHLVKSDALRAAETGPGGLDSSLEAVLARVSAEVTAEAARRRAAAETKPGGAPSICPAR
jgi:hypothetical protein